MAVPVIRTPRLQLAPLPAARTTVNAPRAAFDASGGTAGEALSNLGRGLQSVGDTLFSTAIRQQIEANETAAENAYTGWLAGMTSLTTEFSELTDLGPSEQRADFDRRADELAEQYLGGLETQRARELRSSRSAVAVWPSPGPGMST